MLEMRRPSVFGENLSLEPGLFLFHQVQDPFVLVRIQPKAVPVLAEIHLEVVKPVLKSFHQLAALGAFAGGDGGAEDHGAFLVFAEIEGFVLELFKLLAAEPHPPTARAIFDLDAVALRLHQVLVAVWAFHRSFPSLSIVAAGIRFGSAATAVDCRLFDNLVFLFMNIGSFGVTGHSDPMPLWVDAVEKGKNEPIEIFACASVETVFS
jgi:hypothetical protein